MTPAAHRFIGEPFTDIHGEWVRKQVMIKTCDICGAPNCAILYIKPGEPTRCFCFAHNPAKATKEKVDASLSFGHDDRERAEAQG